MEIYLVRHTAPEISKGVCYGQADIGVRSSFLEEASIIQFHLPEKPDAVYSSPLIRCRNLATHLYSRQAIQLHDDLKEINCGHWELKVWDDIPPGEVRPWVADRVNVRIPGGESYLDVFERVTGCFDAILDKHWLTPKNPALKPGTSNRCHQTVIVAHGGVLRSILAHITQTPLAEAFKMFRLYYGCVVKITRSANALQYEILSNVAHEPEIHRPSNL